MAKEVTKVKVQEVEVAVEVTIQYPKVDSKTYYKINVVAGISHCPGHCPAHIQMCYSCGKSNHFSRYYHSK